MAGVSLPAVVPPLPRGPARFRVRPNKQTNKEREPIDLEQTEARAIGWRDRDRDLIVIVVLYRALRVHKHCKGAYSCGRQLRGLALRVRKLRILSSHSQHNTKFES